jgi:hypothetical protein
LYFLFLVTTLRHLIIDYKWQLAINVAKMEPTTDEQFKQDIREPAIVVNEAVRAQQLIMEPEAYAKDVHTPRIKVRPLAS